MKRPNKTTIVAFSVALFEGALFAFLFFWIISSPDAYLIMTSPDGHSHLKLIRKRTPPYFQGVDVIVRLERRSGEVFGASETTSDNRDEWTDPCEDYNTVKWSDESVIIGPGHSEPVVVKLPGLK